MRVQVAYSPAARSVELFEVELPDGGSVEDALRATALLREHPALDLGTLRVGVWGKLCQLGDAVRDGDRIEVYRPLQVDPKEARRLRYRKQADRQQRRR